MDAQYYKNGLQQFLDFNNSLKINEKIVHPKIVFLVCFYQ